MKNVLMTAALILSTAASAANTTITQPVKAEVKNVCIAVTTNNDLTGDGQKDAAAGPVTNEASKPDIAYKANANSNPASTTNPNSPLGGNIGGMYIFRCTSGTTYSATVNGTEVANNVTGKVTLTSALKHTTLIADYTLSAYMLADGDSAYGVSNASGDYYAADASFVASAGQWSAKAAADYTGSIAVEVTFN